MDKEKLITIFIGLIVGAALASAYFLSSKFLPSLEALPFFAKPKAPASPLAKTTPSSTTPGLEITSPDDYTSTTEQTITLSGKAPKDIKLIIFANADEKVIVSDQNGTFETSVKLEEGENEITTTLLTVDGSPTVAKRIVIREVAK